MLQMFINVLIVFALWIVPLVASLWSMLFIRRRLHERDRRNPLSRGMLRGPGHALRERIDDVVGELHLVPAMFAPIPVICFAFVLAKSGLPTLNAIDWCILLVVLVGTVVLIVRKLYSILLSIRNLRLGFEAETAAGQELNVLMKDGFSVFHDVMGDRNFNIDHVVVGRQGVFAIETKGRPKPKGSDGAETYKVRYDGKQLMFPGWSETEPLAQAKRNAEWLRKWLTSAVGEPVEVKPVLMLPGWYIERTSGDGIPVLAGTNCRNFFLKSNAPPLSDKLVQQIIHQLDAKCRDVEPRAYMPMKD